jgi:hypothetical protein
MDETMVEATFEGFEGPLVGMEPPLPGRDGC